MVLVFITLATAILGMISAGILQSSVSSMSAQITRSSTASVRSTVNAVTGQLNRYGPTVVKSNITAAGPAGWSPIPFAGDNNVQGTTTVVGYEYDGGPFTIHLRVTSTGTIKWTREATAVLELAGVTGIDSVTPHEGGTAWDYGDEGGPMLALWTATSVKVGE